MIESVQYVLVSFSDFRRLYNEMRSDLFLIFD